MKRLVALLCALLLGATPLAAQQGAAVGPAVTAIGSAAPGQIPGTATNDNACVGCVGQLISSTVLIGSAISITTGTAANVTTIPLTAGDWDVSGEIIFGGAATTNFNSLLASISATPATLDTTPGNVGLNSYGAAGIVPTAGNGNSVQVGPVRVSLSGSATYNLVEFSNFTISTATAWGIIRARRVR